VTIFKVAGQTLKQGGKEMTEELARDYDGNIVIMGEEFSNTGLDSNEWYALMVTDYSPRRKNRSDMFLKEKGWVGLECTSNGTVYISKRKGARNNLSRGMTVVVRVGDESLCYELA